MQTITLLLMVTTITAGRPFDHVRQYLSQHDEKPTGRLDGTNWLENSNTIGLGYNPLLGSPVCYTGTCQSDGYRRSVFKLVYKQPTFGSCTTKLIPDNVELHCIPSSELITNTETISTLNQLSESISNGISFGADVKYKMFSAGYSYSKETRFMIDQLIKQDTTSMHTTGKVTYGKLSMFEQFMELSDTFRYVIQEMPCCKDDDELQQYIQEFIISHFGFTFVTELTLGGIAQQTMFITNKEMKKMEQSGVNIQHSASIGYFLTFNMKVTSSYDKKKQEEFMQSVKTIRATKLGGDPSLEKIDEWIKSVPNSPVIMSISVKGIVLFSWNHISHHITF